MSPPARLPRDADALLRALVDRPVPPPAPPSARELRTRVVARMEAQMADAVTRRARRATWRRRAWLIGAAACLPLAISAVVLGVRAGAMGGGGGVYVTALSGDAEIAHGGAGLRLTAATPTAFDLADELRTGPDGLARASLPNGAVVDVGPRARLRFRTTGDRRHGSVRARVELVAGRVSVEVPRLPDGDEVSVDTAGVSVVVHGTKFSVERSSPAGGPGETRVEVIEGRVAVHFGHEERLLSAGASLVLPDADAADAAVAAVAPPADAPDGGPPSSTLGAENELLGSAMRLRHQRDAARSLALLDEFLERYPRSPLAETARVEKIRVLDETGAPGAARREAQRYLADYPHGHARKEATAILSRTRAHAP